MQTPEPGALTAWWMDESQHADRSNRGNFPSPIQRVISRSDAPILRIFRSVGACPYRAY